MPFTRWVIFASFTIGIIALSLQTSGVASATQGDHTLVTDQSSSASQDTQRDSYGGKKSTSSAESSGKMQSEKDSPSGSEIIDSTANKKPRLSHEKSGTSEGSKPQDSGTGGSKGLPAIPGGGSNSNTGPGSK